MTSTLTRLAAALGGERRGEASVIDVTHDSRQAGPGVLFCAIPGALADGHDHAAEAVERGAAALLVERWLDLDAPQLRVPDARAAAGPAAALVHDEPSRDLRVVGITGTNGKTTTAYLVEAAFAAAGLGSGLIGTVEARIHGDRVPGLRTTPEGPDLQRLLAQMRARGVEGVAMEVSSHGVTLHRVAGLHLAVAVFTNLSQDHLDFHGTMQDYYAAKRAIFAPAWAERAVVCVDDGWGRRLAGESRVPTVSFGRRDADVEVRIVARGVDGSTAILSGAVPDGEVVLTTRLLGDFNVSNAAGAYLAATAAGVPSDAALAGIAASRGAPGRLERVVAGQRCTALVDYAHTPDAVASVVAALRALVGPEGRLVVVLGAGGDRDRDKRGPMGAAAAAADVVVVTSDNPRSEDPDAIVAAVAAGARSAGGAQVMVEPDRRAAIAHALDLAGPDDVLLVAGKGHETYQEVAGVRRDFDDRKVLAELALDGHGRASIGGAA